MPLLSIDTNRPLEGEDARALVTAASQLVADQLGKPERYVMVKAEFNPHMAFAGSDAPLAYLELKSIGLPVESTTSLSSVLTALLQERLGIPGDRVYIEFANAERHMWGWNGGTF